MATLPLVQRAWQDVRNSRDWSFLKGVGVYFTPSPITSGTAQVTQFSTTIVADATATPLWQAIALPAPPASPITLRQFRTVGGPIYSIVGYDGVSTATLDRPFAEQSAAASSYMIYQPYAPVPTLDFKRYLSWTDTVNNYRFRYRNLYRTTKELDRRDPNRQNYSNPIMLAMHDYVTVPGDTQSRPRHELWPGPVQQIGYILEYFTRGDFVNGLPLSPTVQFPTQVPDALVMARARHYGHELVANQPDTDIKNKAFHLNALTRVDAEYRDLLTRACLSDNSISDSLVITEESSGPVWSGPLDSDYIMSHDLFVIE